MNIRLSESRYILSNPSVSVSFAALALTLSLLLSIILHTGILIAKPKAKVLNPTPVSYVIVIVSFYTGWFSSPHLPHFLDRLKRIEGFYFT